jgi:hypothetical protein
MGEHGKCAMTHPGSIAQGYNNIKLSFAVKNRGREKNGGGGDV